MMILMLEQILVLLAWMNVIELTARFDQQPSITVSTALLEMAYVLPQIFIWALHYFVHDFLWPPYGFGTCKLYNELLCEFNKASNRPLGQVHILCLSIFLQSNLE